MTALRAVLFDLDGTLADTAPDLAAAVNAVAIAQGREPLPLATLRPHVSKGGRALLACAFDDWPDDRRDALLPQFLAFYGEALAVQTRAFAGIEALLAHIEQRGWRWGVVTNKPEGLAVGVVEGLGWQRRCGVLVGGDTLPTKKPSPEPLWHAAAALDLPSSSCLYVGDDRRDIDAANAAGMPAVAALWGYRDPMEVPAAWPAQWHCDLPSDLLQRLQAMP